MAKGKRKGKKAKAAKATGSKGSCPECGGTPRGRGYAHAAGCSKATRVAAAGKRRGRPKGKRGSKGIDIDAMSLEELHSLHQRITKKVTEMRGLLDKFKV